MTQSAGAPLLNTLSRSFPNALGPEHGGSLGHVPHEIIALIQGQCALILMGKLPITLTLAD